MTNKRLLLCFVLSLFTLNISLAQENDYELLFPKDDESFTTKGEYTEGKRSGTWSVYNSDSSYFHTGAYRDGKRNGLWLVYINKLERARLFYEADTIAGPYILFHPNGALSVRANFAGNQLEGK